MKEIARIDLPPHQREGEFDHGAVDPTGDRLYVAHPSNDAVEVVDLAARRHRTTLSGLRGVAGVWVDAAARRLFTSNRGEDTVSIFDLGGVQEVELHRVPTGVRPNGLAFDRGRGVLLVAGVGDPKTVGAGPTFTFLDAETGTVHARLDAPGRTRWAIFHPPTDRFYVNIADPPAVVAIPAGGPPSIVRQYPVPARGPHGLEQDPGGDRLYCACDDGALVTLTLESGLAEVSGRLSGAPDVLWVDPGLQRLFCAVGSPGTVDVFDLDPVRLAERAPTEEGSHTLTVDARRNEVHVFLPGSHADLVLAGL